MSHSVVQRLGAPLSGPLWGQLFHLVEQRGLPRTSVWSHKAHWTRFTVPKADGSRRPIEAPDDLTKAMARVLDAWLWKQWSPRYESGFKPGEGTPEVLDRLAEWRSRRFGIVALDLASAFSRVHASQVNSALRALGMDKSIRRLAVRTACRDGWLVMGSPVAPQLFALVVERALFHVEREFMPGCEVIAYADDVYVATPEGAPLPRRWKRKLSKLLWVHARQRLNTRKTEYVSPRSPLHALGVRISKTGNNTALRPATQSRMHAMQAAARGDGQWRTLHGPVDASAAAESAKRWASLVLHTATCGEQYAEWLYRGGSSPEEHGLLDSVVERTQRGGHPACLALV